LADSSSHLEISTEATWTIDRLIQRSARITGARLPASFARGDGGPSTLARLLRGGRGGAVRIKLYLSKVLLAGSMHNHPVHGRNTIFNVSGATWARALALPDPPKAGARRVADAQNQLASMGLIELQRQPSQPPITKLLHPTGSGAAWVEPGTPYIRIPLEVWSNRWIWHLSAKELAVYVAILDLCAGNGVDGTGGPQALSGTHLRRYGISEDTWRIASASLEMMSLIHTDIAVVGADLATSRRRKRYQLIPGALDSPAPIASTRV